MLMSACVCLICVCVCVEGGGGGGNKQGYNSNYYLIWLLNYLFNSTIWKNAGMGEKKVDDWF